MKPRIATSVTRTNSPRALSTSNNHGAMLGHSASMMQHQYALMCSCQKGSDKVDGRCTYMNAQASPSNTSYAPAASLPWNDRMAFWIPKERITALFVILQRVILNGSEIVFEEKNNAHSDGH